MPELRDLLNVLSCKAAKWYTIGIQLYLEPGELDNIEVNGKGVEEQLRKMLQKCLSKNNPPLTWTTLIKALREPAVSEFALAEKLEKQFVTCGSQNEPLLDLKQNKPTQHSRSQSPTEPDHHRCSCVKANIAQLEDKYRTVGLKLIRCLKQKKVTVEELQEYAATIPSRVRRRYKKLNKRPSHLTKAESVADFVATLNMYSTCLNPSLLDDTVKKYGDDETQRLMRDFMKELDTFRKTTKVRDFMGKWKGETPPGYHKLSVEVPNKWKEKSLEEIEEIKEREWLLEMIIEGSVIIVFSVPEPISLKTEGFVDFLRQYEVLSVQLDGKYILEPASLTDEESTERVVESRAIECAEAHVHEKDLPPQSDPVTLKTDIASLKSEFKAVLDRFAHVLTQREASAEKVEEYIGRLPLTVKQHYDDLMKQPSSLEEPTTAHIDCFIDALATYTFILNPVLLANAVKENGDEETQHKMETFTRQIEEFQKQTKLADLVDTWSEELLPNHKQVSVDSKWEDKTLYELVQILNAMRAFGWHIMDIKLGDDCVTVTFSAQQPVSISKGVAEFLRPHQVLRIQIEGEPIVDLETPQGDTSPTQEKAFVLPEIAQFGFHPAAGTNVILSEDCLEAERKDLSNDFNTAVYGAKPLEGTAEFEVELTNVKQGFVGGTLQLGIVWRKTGTEILQQNIPRWSLESDDYCIWYYSEVWNKFHGELTKTKYGKLSPNDIQQGDKVGMRLTRSGDLTFFVNGKNQGIAARNVYKEGYDVYVVVDVRRRCYAVKITRAALRSDDFTLQELCIEEVARFVKSSEQVRLLPLPPKLKDQIHQYVADL